MVLRGLRGPEGTEDPVRITTVFNKLLALQGAFVKKVEFGPAGIVVDVGNWSSEFSGRKVQDPAVVEQWLCVMHGVRGTVTVSGFW
jgi:hypothetical protein